jgi:pimeloyl-ACP methyl ester carboxylesterase
VSCGGSAVTFEGASHFPMVSEPDNVAGVIRDAVKSAEADLAA